MQWCLPGRKKARRAKKVAPHNSPTVELVLVTFTPRFITRRGSAAGTRADAISARWLTKRSEFSIAQASNTSIRCSPGFPARRSQLAWPHAGEKYEVQFFRMVSRRNQALQARFVQRAFVGHPWTHRRALIQARP